MKNTILVLVTLSFLASCALVKDMTSSEASKEVPSMTIRSEKCFESQKLKVFQVLDDGIMAHICPVNFPSYFENAFEACVTKGDLAYMPVRSSQNDYVDEQKVVLPENKCFGSDGTYSYITAQDNMKKTIRKIKIIDSQVPNPAYKELKKKP